MTGAERDIIAAVREESELADEVARAYGEYAKVLREHAHVLEVRGGDGAAARATALELHRLSVRIAELKAKGAAVSYRMALAIGRVARERESAR